MFDYKSLYFGNNFRSGFGKFSFVERGGLPVLRKSLKGFKKTGSGRKHFAREVIALEKLADACFVPNLIGFDLDCDVPYIDFQPLLGANMVYFLENVENPLEHFSAIRILVERVRTLHSLDFVHRDLKPGNCFLPWTANGYNPIILDWGLVSHPSIKEVYEKSTRGTPGYRSPEQINGDSVDQRSDIYSLGVLMYEFFTGVSPFGGSGSLVDHYHLNKIPKHPSDRKLLVPRDLGDIVMKCLEKKPEDRYQNCGELYDALDCYEKDL